MIVYVVPFLTRFLVLRTSPRCTSAVAEHMGELITASLPSRLAHIIVCQHSSDPSRCVVQCSPAHRTERHQRNLQEEGFDSSTGGLSPELDLREGQELTVRFRGNVGVATNDRVDHTSTQAKKMAFNSHIKARWDFEVCVLDSFAQKSLECFRGFCQFYSSRTVTRTKTLQEDNNRKPLILTEEVEEEYLLCELLLNLPKVRLHP